MQGKNTKNAAKNTSITPIFLIEKNIRSIVDQLWWCTNRKIKTITQDLFLPNT